jgi:hypothetical protein
MSAMFSYSKPNIFANLRDFVLFLILKVVVFDELLLHDLLDYKRGVLLGVNAFA